MKTVFCVRAVFIALWIVPILEMPVGFLAEYQPVRGRPQRVFQFRLGHLWNLPWIQCPRAHEFPSECKFERLELLSPGKPEPAFPGVLVPGVNDGAHPE